MAKNRPLGCGVGKVFSEGAHERLASEETDRRKSTVRRSASRPYLQKMPTPSDESARWSAEAKATLPYFFHTAAHIRLFRYFGSTLMKLHRIHLRNRCLPMPTLCASGTNVRSQLVSDCDKEKNQTPPHEETGHTVRQWRIESESEPMPNLTKYSCSSSLGACVDVKR